MQGALELRKELSPETIEELFDTNRGTFRIKPCLADGIRWLVADARDPNLIDLMGVQDVLLANNFLVHMKPAAAAECMTCLLRLVRPGGLFVCRGVDLSVRESVARRSGLEPITDEIQQIHDADPLIDAPKDWPWKYWGLEPMDLTRRDWPTRYAAIFRVPRIV
jgi:SAM-dependent methyltransferase